MTAQTHIEEVRKCQRLAPEGSGGGQGIVQYRGVVDQYIQPTLFPPHLLEQLRHLRVVRMVAVHRYPAAAGSGHGLGRGLHRPRQRGISLAPGAPGNIDRSTGCPEGDSNALPRPAAGAGHHYHPVLHQCHGYFLWFAVRLPFAQ